MLFTAYLTIHEIFFYSPLFYVDFLDKVPCSPVRYWDMTLNFRFFCLRDDRHRPPCQPNFFFFFDAVDPIQGFVHAMKACYKLRCIQALCKISQCDTARDCLQNTIKSISGSQPRVGLLPLITTTWKAGEGGLKIPDHVGQLRLSFNKK